MADNEEVSRSSARKDSMISATNEDYKAAGFYNIAESPAEESDECPSISYTYVSTKATMSPGSESPETVSEPEYTVSWSMSGPYFTTDTDGDTTESDQAEISEDTEDQRSPSPEQMQQASAPETETDTITASLVAKASEVADAVTQGATQAVEAVVEQVEAVAAKHSGNGHSDANHPEMGNYEMPGVTGLSDFDPIGPGLAEEILKEAEDE